MAQEASPYSMPGRILSKKALPRGSRISASSILYFSNVSLLQRIRQMLPPRIPRTARAPYTQGLCWSPALGIFVRILDGWLIRSSPLPSSSISYWAVMIPFFLGSSIGSVSGVSVSSGVSGSVSLSSSGTGRSGFSGFPGFSGSFLFILHDHPVYGPIL